MFCSWYELPVLLECIQPADGFARTDCCIVLADMPIADNAVQLRCMCGSLRHVGVTAAADMQ